MVVVANGNDISGGGGLDEGDISGGEDVGGGGSDEGIVSNGGGQGCQTHDST